jgi:hypothetical protein
MICILKYCLVKGVGEDDDLRLHSSCDPGL